MRFLKSRRVMLPLGGGVVALLAGVVAAGVVVSQHRGEPTPPPPASQGGLVIDSAPPAESQAELARPLRCFVAGQFAGELTLPECARRNGVATEALDVGLDPSGALAAAQQAGVMITPLPPREETPAPPRQAASAAAPTGPCWRYDGGWRRLADMTLDACIRTLFAGRCERPGGAAYGRWMHQTVRLVPGRVEISADNHSFRRLVEQSAGCAIPPVG